MGKAVLYFGALGQIFLAAIASLIGGRQQFDYSNDLTIADLDDLQVTVFFQLN